MKIHYNIHYYSQNLQPTDMCNIFTPFSNNQTNYAMRHTVSCGQALNKIGATTHRKANLMNPPFSYKL